MRVRLPAAFPTVAALFLLVACAPEQIRAVRRFNEQADPVQLACLDVNEDGAVDANDTGPTALLDVTGDGVVNDSDLAVISQVQFGLPNGRPPDCLIGTGALPDWQVSAPPVLDCTANDRGVLLLAVGGGAVDLATLGNAAGARWMVEELANDLDVPAQIASVAPGLNGTSLPQPDAEDWAFAFVSERLREQPCLKVVLLGHSHGGTLATVVASRLEQAGLGKQILVTVLVDRVTFLYAGDTTSMPQSSPVFNVWLPAPGQDISGSEIDQSNVENLAATGMKAPARGELGGPLQPVTHGTIDNSKDVLREVENRVLVLAKAPEW